MRVRGWEGGIFSVTQGSLRNDMLITLIVMIALGACTYDKIHPTVHFKYVKFTIWQLHLDKTMKVK